MLGRMRVLILGAGFAGSYVARLLGKRAPDIDVTLVDPRNYMLYTPLLPEAASGTVEPRHAVVPVRVMCPHARLLLGRAAAVDMSARTATVRPAEGDAIDVEFDTLVVALGAIARTAPVPGLVEHAVGFKTIAEAIHLRNHVLQQLELAATIDDPGERERRLTFVFVGGGYAGVEAMAELEDLVRDASRHYPTLRDVPRRWLLADAADHILNDLRGRLGEYAAKQLERRGFELRLNTVLSAVDATGVELSDGERVSTATLVWTAGVRPNPLDRRARPSARRPRPHPSSTSISGPGTASGRWATRRRCPTLRQTARPTRPPASTRSGRRARWPGTSWPSPAAARLKPYRYRMLGQAATLGRHKGVCEVVGGLRFRGFAGWWLTRTYHLYQLPLMSRRLRVVSDWTVGLFFRRDVVELGSFGRPEPLEPPAR